MEIRFGRSEITKSSNSEISSRGKKMPEDAAEFSSFLRKYIARSSAEFVGRTAS